MVNVVIGSIVVSKVLQRIPGESIAAMIVHSLDSGAREEPHGLTVRHARCQKRNASTSGIKKEAFHRVIIEGAESVRDIKTMVTRVESDCKVSVASPRSASKVSGTEQSIRVHTVKPAVQMHRTVEEILPSIDDKHSHCELYRRDKVPVDETGH